MTTIIATKDGIYADTLCSYTVPFKARKYAKIGKSVFAGAGDLDDLMKFFEWRRHGGDAPSKLMTGSMLSRCAKKGYLFGARNLSASRLTRKFTRLALVLSMQWARLLQDVPRSRRYQIAASLDTGTGLPIEFAKFKRA